ncbi:MerR family transcriptional regulator [Embleya sp. NBC_00896]|uniref:MerR family transcriptional regulator n=1 Tax=Embleya sp. NBC_00896 TaxID=2975961 RepID=UPI003868DDF5|nr:MerR family transcriptional regulator [Embleya sp. NBC_00896]
MTAVRLSTPDDYEVGKYSIGEVVERTGLTAHTLRWYERIGLMQHVSREGPRTGRDGNGRGSRRRYSDHDLTWLEFVGKMRLTGMPVADMIRYAELVRAGDHTRAARRQLLVDHREEVRNRISDLQSCLLVIDYKIETYAESDDDEHSEAG